MAEPLYDAIAEAIDKPLDGGLFEKCAAELLREFYPSLQPISGGNDAGMDGTGTLTDGEEFFLVSTVMEDSLANLAKNIGSHIRAGGSRRAVVFATSRNVSGQRRVQLSHRLLDDYGVRLVDVYDRAAFIGMLYRNPTWRRDLLGVPGDARALSRLPLTGRPTPEIPPIGREEDLERLDVIENDLVLVGKPGIGKTFLLETLADRDWCLFDEGWDMSFVEDAILALRPKRIVVDDAHLNIERLGLLRHLRRVMDADFNIVAVSWPGPRDQISHELPGSTIYEIRELDRDQILEVVKAVGVEGPTSLQALLVNQSLGRPGLAVTLAYSCVTGDIRTVATGDALMSDVVGWYSRSMGADSRHVLGVLALAGDHGVSTAGIAASLGLPLTRISDLVRGLASGGTVDEAGRGLPARIRLQPESLRYPLVKASFFDGPGALDVSSVLQSFDSPAQALLPLVGAIHRGASVDRGFLRGLIDEADSSAVTAYALLGLEEAREMLAVAPQHRAEIARRAYEAGIGGRIALRVLMEEAVGNTRPPHNDPAHPLRVIEDYLSGANGSIAARQEAIAEAKAWLSEGGDRSIVLAVLMLALKPGTQRVSVDPGLGNTITISEAVLPPEQIQALEPLWDEVLQVLEEVDLADYSPLVNGLHGWVYPSSLAFGREPEEATTDAIRSLVSQVLVRLVAIMRDRPGVLHQLRDAITNADLGITVEIPRLFDVLFPRDWDGRDEDEGHEGWSRRAANALRALATELADLSVDEIADQIANAESAAKAVGLTYPRLTPSLAQILGSSLESPVSLLLALKSRGVSGDVLMPLLSRAVELEADGWEELVGQFLSNEGLVGYAMQVAFTKPVGMPLRRLAVQHLTPGYSRLIEFLLARGELDADTVALLLTGAAPEVAQQAAIALVHQGQTFIAALEPSLQARWRELIVESPADDYWYTVLFKREPELFAEWLRAWFSRLADDASPHQSFPFELRDSVRELPASIRRDLIADVPAQVPSFFVQDVVTSLVGDDLEVAVALLDRDDLDDLHWTALRVGPNEQWMERALLLQERGWEPERIVGPTRFAESGWSGEESAHWQRHIDAFVSLDIRGDSRRAAIIHAGLERFAALKAAAEERERQDRIFGYDR